MNEIGIKDQCFGVEVEMTGITREHLLANFEGDRARRRDKDSYACNQKKKKREMER